MTPVVPAVGLRAALGVLTATMLAVAATGTAGLPGAAGLLATAGPAVAAAAISGTALVSLGTAARPGTWLPGAAIAVALVARVVTGPGPASDPAGAVALAGLAVAVHSLAAWCAVLPARGRAEAAVLVAPAARVALTAAGVAAVALLGGVTARVTGAGDPAAAPLAVLAGVTAVALAVAVARRAPARR
jgi:hypothetical protein